MSRPPFVPPVLASPPGTNLGSRLIGDLAHTRLPGPMLQRMIRAYARFYDLDLEEIAAPVESYKTFAEFFTRRLRPGARPLARELGVVVSPVDGTIQSLGRVTDGSFDQIKGHSYSAETFLGGPAEAAPYMNGWYVVIYLSPADYHRIHSPVDGQVISWTHIPGTLCSVQPFFSNLVAGLLVSNERIITHMKGSMGPTAVGMVGACGVGRIRLAFDEMETNVSLHPARRDRRYNSPIERTRGDELGVFDLGSTVVLFINNPDLRPAPAVEPGASIRYGAPLLKLQRP